MVNLASNLALVRVGPVVEETFDGREGPGLEKAGEIPRDLLLNLVKTQGAIEALCVGTGKEVEKVDLLVMAISRNMLSLHLPV